MNKIAEKIRKNLGLQIGALIFIALLSLSALTLIFLSLSLKVHLEKSTALNLLFFFMLVTSIASLFLTKLFVEMILGRSLAKITQVLQRAEKGDFEARTNAQAIDEMGILARRVDRMLRKISEMETMKLSAERKLVIAEEELKYKKTLEDKTRIITETNIKLKNTLKEFSLIARLSSTIPSILDPLELYQAVVDIISKELDVHDTALFVYQQKSKILDLMACNHSAASALNLSFKIGESFVGESARIKSNLYVQEANKDQRSQMLQGKLDLENKALLCIPVLRKDKLFGVLLFTRNQEQGFSKSEIELLNILASQIAIATQNANLYSKTKELTMTDDLTQIYNRRYFYQALQMEVQRSKRFNRPISLMMIDVDHFKKFNDTFGHMVGDQVLEEIASVLSKNVREVDTVARYGGEEFSIILLDTDTSQAYRVAEKLRSIVSHHFSNSKFNQKDIAPISVSIGVSNMPSDADNMDDLINHADIALYSAKVKGRNQVVMFNHKAKPTLRAIAN